MISPPVMAEPDPPVVVVLPTFNGLTHIQRQLDALFDQECSLAWHLVVVDGGSTDGTVDLVESIRQAPVTLTLVRLRDGPGVNAGINAGVAATTSEFVLIAEHDDVVAPGWMQALVNALQDTSLVGSRIERFLLNSRSAVSVRSRFPEDVQLRVRHLDATGMAFRRSLWVELGGFNETYTYGGNDAEFCFRAYQAGYGFSIAVEAMTHYRLRETPRDTYRQGKGYGRSMVRLYREFGPDYIQRRSADQVGREVVRLVYWAIRALRNEDYQMRLAYRGGLQMGLLWGSIRYRRIFL